PNPRHLPIRLVRHPHLRDPRGRRHQLYPPPRLPHPPRPRQTPRPTRLGIRLLRKMQLPPPSSPPQTTPRPRPPDVPPRIPPRRPLVLVTTFRLSPLAFRLITFTYPTPNPHIFASYRY